MHVITRYGQKSLAKRVAALLATGCLCLGLLSCGPKVTVYLTGNDPKLTGLMIQLADDYTRTVKGATKPNFITAKPLPTENYGAVLTIGIMAGPTANAGLAAPAFDDQLFKDAGTIQSLSFENWGRVGKKRQAIALAWDPWGFTGLPADLPDNGQKTIQPWVWKDAAHGGLPVILAGRDSGFLSLRFLLSAGLAEAAPTFAAFAISPQAWATDQGLAWFKKFSMAPALPGAVMGSGNFGAADVANFRKIPGKHLVLETFSAQAGLAVQEIRRFRPLVLAATVNGTSKNYLFASVLAAGLSGGDPDSAQAASGFVAFLLNPANQQKLADLTGFLPADYRAPGLNALAAEARKVAIDVDYLLALDPDRVDYGTQTPEWAGLLAEIQRAPGSWEAIVKNHAAITSAKAP